MNLGQPKDVEILPQWPLGPTDSEDAKTRISLSALPAVLLDVEIPPEYPLNAPPEILSIDTTFAWLSVFQDLKGILLSLWQTGEVVLFNWVEHIHTGTFLEEMPGNKDGISESLR